MAGLNQQAIQLGLADPEAWHIQVFDELPSTNSLALERAAAGAPERTVLLADSQTDGRGRAGREWRTPQGTALALSIIFRPTIGRALWPWFGLAAALAVRDAVERVAGISGAVKWPNDVLIAGRKVAGILLETRHTVSPASDGAIVVGIGINVNNRSATLPKAFRNAAISLLDASGTVIDRNELTAATLDAVNAGISGLPDTVEALRDRWRSTSATFGAMVAVSTPGGLVEGIDDGLDSQGRLVVRTREGERTVHTGEVLLCRTAAPLAN
jgi:BirA family biotin operon repressor/biotin-[acetyl-CoA-carboxylase] ligase